MAAELHGDVPVSVAQSKLATVIDQATAAGEPVYLTRAGRRVAAIIGAEDLEWLTQLAEDLIDLRGAQAARKEMRDRATQVDARPARPL